MAKTKKRAPEKSKDHSIYLLSHILGLVTGFLGPLIIFLSTDDPLAKKHSANALNWQISMTIYMIVSVILVMIFIGILLMVALGIMNIIFCILAAIRANEGKLWEYPLTIKFIKN